MICCKNDVDVTPLKAVRYFNIEVEIYYFYQFTILISFLSFRYGYFLQ